MYTLMNLNENWRGLGAPVKGIREMLALVEPRPIALNGLMLLALARQFCSNNRLIIDNLTRYTAVCINICIKSSLFPKAGSIKHKSNPHISPIPKEVKNMQFFIQAPNTYWHFLWMYVLCSRKRHHKTGQEMKITATLWDKQGKLCSPLKVTDNIQRKLSQRNNKPKTNSRTEHSRAFSITTVFLLLVFAEQKVWPELISDVTSRF